MTPRYVQTGSWFLRAFIHELRGDGTDGWWGRDSVDEVRTPAVSVVIPTHGRPDLLPRTIASIAAQDLNAPVECIIVHDAPPR